MLWKILLQYCLCYYYSGYCTKGSASSCEESDMMNRRELANLCSMILIRCDTLWFRYEVEVKMITRCTSVNVKDDVKYSNGNEHNCLFENMVTPEIHARGLWLAVADGVVASSLCCKVSGVAGGCSRMFVASACSLAVWCQGWWSWMPKTVWRQWLPPSFLALVP